MLVALEEKVRDPQVTYIYIFFILWVPWTCTPNLMGTDARVAEALESRAKWRTNDFTSIEPHRHGERYIRVIQFKKKKKTVTQAFTNHISSHLWRRKFQHLQNPLLNMTDLKRRARWILLKANPVRSEWRMWSKRKKHKRSMELTLTLSPFVRMSQSVCWNLVRSIWWPPPNNAWGEQVRIKQSTF